MRLEREATTSLKFPKGPSVPIYDNGSPPKLEGTTCLMLGDKNTGYEYRQIRNFGFY